MSSPEWTPQKFDSIARTVTTALISILLVGAVIYEAITRKGNTPSYLDLALVGWAGTVVGFYLGGHVAQNTASLEELRLKEAARQSEDSATRSEASAVRSEHKDA